MAEIRELLLEDHMGASLFRLPGWGRMASALKLALRRFVVLTAGTPLRFFYRAAYRIHVRYALRKLKQLPGVRSIYVARGVASGDILYGVSDIDLVVLGDWSDAEHAQVMSVLRRLSATSPLFDASLWQHAHAVSAMRDLYATDFYYQFRFDQGRTQWKLLHGEDVLASLPPIPVDRVAGGYYMDVRNWWDAFTKSALGTGVTARDSIFQHSIAYKAAAEIVNKALALEDGSIEHARQKGIEKALARAAGADREFLTRLRVSAEKRHLSFSGDIRQETLQFILRTLETINLKIADTPAFAPLVDSMSVDAPVEEIFRTTAANEQISEVLGHVKRNWSGYQGAAVVPSVSFFNLDGLILLIKVDPADLPHVRQLRELCGMYARASSKLRQRVALSLLLQEGAYQIESVSYLELWHLVISPAANPDIFSLLSTGDFAIDGAPQTWSRTPVWTKFAGALIEEEITVRRAAMVKPNAGGSLSSLELVRNIWRQLQLEVIERSTKAGQAFIPLTPEAVQRALLAAGFPGIPALDRLLKCYRAELEGQTSDVQPLIAEIMAVLATGK